VIDPSTGTVRLKAEFPNQDKTRCSRTQFVNAPAAGRRQARPQLSCPRPPFNEEPGDVRLRRERRSHVELRPVQIDVTEGDTASVATGLAPGEMVVVDGADGLRNGTKVEVQARGSQSQPDRS